MLRAILVPVLFLQWLSSAQAVTRVWDGSASGLWSVNANWIGGVRPQNGDKVEFPAGVAQKAVTNDLVGLVLQGMRFPDAGSSGYIVRGNEVIFQADATDPSQSSIIRTDHSSGVVRIECPLNFGASFIPGGAFLFVANAGGELEVISAITLGSGTDLLARCLGPRLELGGPISGTGDLVLNFLSSATIEMTGILANTFDGITSLEAGTLEMSRGFFLLGNFIPAVSIPGDFSVSGATVELLQPGQIANSSRVFLNGTLNMNGNNDGIGTLVLFNGTVNGAGATLGLNGDVVGIANSAGQILANVDLGNTTHSVSNIVPIPIVINGVISGTGGLTKEGTGTLRFEGGTANTYSGVTTVKAGVLELAKTSGFSITGSQLIIGDSSDGEATDTVRYASSFDISVTPLITVHRTGLLDFGAFTDDIGSLNLDGGIVQSSTGQIQLRGNVTATASSSGLTPIPARIIGDLDLGGNIRTFTVNDDSFLAGVPIDLEVDAIVSGTGGITKSGAGEMRLNNSNTFSGLVTVNNGVLIANDNSAFGATSTGTIVSGAGTLELLNVAVLGETLTLNSTASEPGALFADGTTNFWSGNVTVTGTARIGVDTNCTLNITAPISGTGGVEKQDDGQLIFRGATGNSYAGTTIVKAGSLFPDQTGTGGIPGDLIIGDGVGGADADLVFFSNNQINNSANVTIASSGKLTLGSDTVGSLSGNGRVEILSTGILRTGGNNASTTYDGQIIGSGGELMKQGNGVFTLNGNNTYNDFTTIQAGTLVVNGSQSASDVIINAGATLSGTGRAGDINAQTGSSISPGTSPGQLRSGNATITNSSTFVVEINGSTPGTGHDQLSVSGTVNLTGSQLTVILNHVPVQGDVYRIIDNNGTDTITGTFTGLANNATLTVNGTQLRVNYNGGTGNDVTLTVIGLPLSPSIDIQPVIGTGNNDGRLDPNECNTLTLAVKNGSAATVSNIVGTLSTTTPGVVITEPVSPYPNLAPSATGTNLAPFQFYTTTGFACGETIEFLLTLTSSNHVPFALPYTIQSGVLGVTKSFTNSSPTGLPGSGTIPIPIVVSGLTGNVANVTVAVNLTYPNLGELLLWLVPPGGSPIPLASGLSGSQLGTNCTNGRTIFNDSANLAIGEGASPYVGSFRPAAPLWLLDGIPDIQANSVWQLQVQDLVPNASIGSVSCWSISITPSTCTDGGGPCTPCNGPFFGSITTNTPFSFFPAGHPPSAPTTCAFDPCTFLTLSSSQRTETFTFTNASGPACVTATIDAPCADSTNVLTSIASLVSGGPVPCGPIGYSGPITNPPVSYSFSVPSNGVFSIQVAGLCENYSLRVDGFECPVQLGIGRVGSNVRIDWPTHGLGYQLQSTTNLPATNWVLVTNVPVAQEGSFVVSNNAANPQQYYRLVAP